MKKIIFTLFAFLIFSNITKANTWQEEKLEGSNVETEYRYKFYKEEKNGEYIRIGQETNYKYEDTNDIIYGDFGNYTSTCTEEIGYQTEKRIKYKYVEPMYIQYIKIKNSNNHTINISKINVYNNNTILEHKIHYYANGGFAGLSINSGGYTIISLPNSILITELTLNIIFQTKDIEYELSYSNNENFNSNNIIAKVTGNSNKTKYVFNETFELSNNKKIYESYDIKPDESYDIISIEEQCKKREIKTYRYNIEKIYYDNNYYKDIEQIKGLGNEEKKLYKKDINNYKIFYRYKEDKKQEEPIKDNKTEENKEVLLNNKKDNNYEEIKLVKTGIKKKINYKNIILYIFNIVIILIILTKKEICRKKKITNFVEYKKTNYFYDKLI